MAGRAVLAQTLRVLRSRLLPPPPPAAAHAPATCHVLYDFREAATVPQWLAVTDATLGGFSRATWTAGRDAAVFAGDLSTRLPANAAAGKAVLRSGYCLARSKYLPVSERARERECVCVYV